jgi:hypothetical protein
MRNSESEAKELSELIKQVGDDLITEYHEHFCEVFSEHELGYEHPPAPLEVFAGIAQALADASGYRVVLQEHEITPHESQPASFRIIGFRDAATREPFIFRTF